MKLLEAQNIIHTFLEKYENEKLNKPFRLPKGSRKKFGVYVKDPSSGKVKKVLFGDPNLSIKRDQPDRLKAFRARHGCDKDPGPITKAKYWSCKFWEKDKSVTDLLKEEEEFYTKTGKLKESPKDKISGLPKRYVTGLSSEEALKKAKHIKDRKLLPQDHPNAYEPTDDVKNKIPTKPSKYTKKYHEMFKESIQTGLKNKSKESGVPYKLLKKVYDRGAEAWRTGGHRPGATQQQWAYARVNSFLTGGKTQKTTDKDIWNVAKKYIKK